MIKICVAVILKNYYEDRVEVSNQVRNIMSFAEHADKIIIYNCCEQENNNIYDKLIQFKNIEIINTKYLGMEQQSIEIYDYIQKLGFDFGIIIKEKCYYEDDGYFNFYKKLNEVNLEEVAVITPSPLFGCELSYKNVEEQREIKGCKLIGAAVNMKLYASNPIVNKNYYETTYDYDYCLKQRSLGKKVILFNNICLKNDDYHILYKRVVFVTYTTYDRNLEELYYETRNRHYLWDEYKQTDSEYVKLDKTLFLKEMKEIKKIDPKFTQKIAIINKAKKDYLDKIKGKI